MDSYWDLKSDSPPQEHHLLFFQSECMNLDIENRIHMEKILLGMWIYNHIYNVLTELCAFVADWRTENSGFIPS